MGIHLSSYTLFSFLMQGKKVIDKTIRKIELLGMIIFISGMGIASCFALLKMRWWPIGIVGMICLYFIVMFSIGELSSFYKIVYNNSKDAQEDKNNA